MGEEREDCEEIVRMVEDNVEDLYKTSLHLGI